MSEARSPRIHALISGVNVVHDKVDRTEFPRLPELFEQPAGSSEEEALSIPDANSHSEFL